jgi:hypothetical protein
MRADFGRELQVRKPGVAERSPRSVAGSPPVPAQDRFAPAPIWSKAASAACRVRVAPQVTHPIRARYRFGPFLLTRRRYSFPSDRRT